MFFGRKTIKRFYDPGTVYFVTSKTTDSWPFFNEAMFEEIFMADRKHAQPWTVFPLFCWQKFFHDHTIRSERDYQYHLRYTAYDSLHHGLADTWRYTSLNFLDLPD